MAVLGPVLWGVAAAITLERFLSRNVYSSPFAYYNWTLLENNPIRIVILLATVIILAASILYAIFFHSEWRNCDTPNTTTMVFRYIPHLGLVSISALLPRWFSICFLTFFDVDYLMAAKSIEPMLHPLNDLLFIVTFLELFLVYAVLSKIRSDRFLTAGSMITYLGLFVLHMVTKQFEIVQQGYYLSLHVSGTSLLLGIAFVFVAAEEYLTTIKPRAR